MQIKYHRGHGLSWAFRCALCNIFLRLLSNGTSQISMEKTPILPALNPFVHLPPMEICAIGMRSRIADAENMNAPRIIPCE